MWLQACSSDSLTPPAGYPLGGHVPSQVPLYDEILLITVLIAAGLLIFETFGRMDRKAKPNRKSCQVYQLPLDPIPVGRLE